MQNFLQDLAGRVGGTFYPNGIAGVIRFSGDFLFALEVERQVKNAATGFTVTLLAVGDENGNWKISVY